MSNTLQGFCAELRDYITNQVKFIDAKRKALAEESEHLSQPSFGIYEPDENRLAELDKLDADLWAKRQAYADIWKKVVREIELDEWLKDVNTWLPQPTSGA